jgi:hypothetical protein
MESELPRGPFVILCSGFPDHTKRHEALGTILAFRGNGLKIEEEGDLALSISVPDMGSERATLGSIVRDIRHTVESCGGALSFK